MKKQSLTLHSSPGGYRVVIKNRHARIIYLSLSDEGERYRVTECRYLDRNSIGPIIPRPQKLRDKYIKKECLLDVIASSLDCQYFDVEICSDKSELSTEDFIKEELLRYKHKYKFLIFIGSEESTDGIPSHMETCFKNRLHRSIYIELAYCDGIGIVKNCYYTDRAYREKDFVTPEMLSSVRFSYNRQAILNIINRELLADFTHIIFVTDGSVDIAEKQPLCGHIIN